jgi:hypothetical protein
LEGGAKGEEEAHTEKACTFARHSIRRTIFIPPEDHLSWVPCDIVDYCFNMLRKPSYHLLFWRTSFLSRRCAEMLMKILSFGLL